LTEHSNAPAVDGRRERLAALLAGALAGRREDLDTIVVELTPLLWRVARAHGVDPAAAEDVVQTTWLILLRHLDRIRTPQALVSWLVTVARREALRVLGKRVREQPVTLAELEPVPDTAERADEVLVLDERRRVLWEAFRKLPERCRRLLQIVAYVDRPDYDEVSVALGMPKGSIGPTRGRCLAKLRTLLLSRPDWSWP
jgi:RNA polymerase sigma factor (sigma-70 family)